jgi:hypothetical protein
MSCNNTNNTCTNCNHNYSSCNNNCAKCGCKDSFLTSPPPCPTPEGCPDPVPCQEVLSSDCIIYNGPNISCNNTVIVTSDSTWAEVLEDLVDYFCITYSNVPLILCSGDTVVTAGSSVNSALQQIVSYFCTEISGLVPVTANNGLNINPASNVRLGGPLIQNTTITNSTFTLDINSTTVAALILSKSSGNSNPTLMINDPSVSTTAQAIQAYSNKFGFTNPVVYLENLSTNISGGQVLTLNGKNNIINTVSPQLTTPILYITSSTTASTTTQVGLRVDNTDNVNAGSGIAIEFANSDSNIGLGFITNRLISKTVNNSNETSMTSEFVIQGKPGGTVNPVDHLTLKSTGQLQLNNYGIGFFTGVPTFNLSTNALGNVIETTAGLFGTAFRASSPPLSRLSVAQTLANSEITNGVTIKPTSDYQIVNGTTVTTMYDVVTGVWTCPQTGKYDINYNVYLTAHNLTDDGWGDTLRSPGQFFIGVINFLIPGITLCADYCTVMNRQTLMHLYLTGGMQGVNINIGTQLVLNIQNMIGLDYVSNPGDNIDWAIRRVG